MELIARQGAGSIRDAESLLDQLVVAPGDTITLERASMVLGTASNTAVIALTDAILNADGSGGLRLIHEALASGADARQFSRQMVAHLRTVLLLQAAGPEMSLDVPDTQLEELLRQAGRAPRPTLIDAIRRFQDAAQKPAISWQPQLPLELAFMEMLPDQPLPVFAVPAKKTVASVRLNPRRSPPRGLRQQRLSPKSNHRPQRVNHRLLKLKQKRSSLLHRRRQRNNTAVTLTLEQLRSQWRGIVSLAGQQSKNLPALLAMCKPLGVEGQMIVLGFDYPIFKEKFDKTEDAAATIRMRLRSCSAAPTASEASSPATTRCQSKEQILRRWPRSLALLCARTMHPDAIRFTDHHTRSKAMAKKPYRGKPKQKTTPGQ